MDKKIIFFDIDGTIWDWNEVIPKSTVKAIRALRDNGHIPVICSGRAKGHLFYDELFGMGFSDMVAACGNYVEADGQIIYERYLSKESLEKIVKMSEECRIPIVLEGRDKHWISDVGFLKDDFVDRMYKVMGPRAIRGLSYGDGMYVNKVSGDVLNCSDYDTFKASLVDEFDFIEHGLALNVDQNPGKDDYAIRAVFEFVPMGSSKATGIRKYCEYRNVDPRDTIAVGDSNNDLEMIEAVGYSIAMGNGTEGIKKIADHVTKDIHEDGIYEAMKYLNLI